jgi:hypothetical protein
MVINMRTHTKEYKKMMSERKRKWWKRVKQIPEKLAEVKRNIGKSSIGRIKGMELHPSWKGGKYTDGRDGYVFIRKTDALSSRSDGYILEHRYVMEKFLGRKLTKNEDVHHKNRIKNDNKIGNLMLISHKQHYEGHVCPKCKFKFYTQ